MKFQIKALLILFFTLLILVVYAMLPKSETLERQLVPIRLTSLQPSETPPSAPVRKDIPVVEPPVQPQKERDTTAQRILFIGDSMLEGLARRAADYALGNGHEIQSVVWYSSNSQQWAETDTLQHFIRKFQPTFIMVCLCSNELFVRDLDNRDRYVRRIVQKIGDIPFVWISPPNWKDDTGINDIIIRHTGDGRYFDSRHYRDRMERRGDHAHPTQEAANWWMDSIAVWLNSMETAHPIRMERPDTVARIKHMTVLQPLNN